MEVTKDEVAKVVAITEGRHHELGLMLSSERRRLQGATQEMCG